MSARLGMRGLSGLALAIAAAVTLAVVPVAMPSPVRDALPGLDAPTLYARVHVIGASASAGFGVRPPVERGTPGRLSGLTLAQVAECAGNGSCRVTGDATALFSASPLSTGTEQVEGLLAMDPRPTVVFADDFLFWFTYGALAVDGNRTPITDESQRLQMLESGLALLDRVVEVKLPLVVGDIPDMSVAVGGMLSRMQMPKPDTLARANERIRAWAAGKPRVAVLPLARLVEELRSGKPFDAGRRSWSEATDGPLIQRDQLHATFAGTVALLARTEQSANERFLGIRQPNAPGAPAVFEHDPATVGARVRESLRAASEALRPAQPAP
ncbi:MAG: hypothetical protein FJ260_02015 [Planctomycetes bacterium]|nr:hypothetical protein [Planctomycetota bacterium]